MGDGLGGLTVFLPQKAHSSLPLTSSGRGWNVEYTQLQKEQAFHSRAESHGTGYQMLDLVFLHAIQGGGSLHIYHPQNGDGGNCRDFQEAMVEADSYIKQESKQCGQIWKT